MISSIDHGDDEFYDCALISAEIDRIKARFTTYPALFCIEAKGRGHFVLSAEVIKGLGDSEKFLDQMRGAVQEWFDEDSDDDPVIDEFLTQGTEPTLMSLWFSDAFDEFNVGMHLHLARYGIFDLDLTFYGFQAEEAGMKTLDHWDSDTSLLEES